MMGPRQTVAVIGFEVLLVITSVAPVFGSGYLTWSIDCGSQYNYTDNATGIEWTTDGSFIQTGRNARNVTVQGNGPFVNRGQLDTLRYFDDSRRRHCYVLPVTPRTTYLLRVTFFLGNWTSSTKSDIDFNIYINATIWLGRPFSPDTDFNQTYLWEIIIYSPGGALNICLGKKANAAAFISSLELRAFASGMYSSAAAGGYQYQHLSRRINAGAPPADPPTYLRYPDDPYDRLWWAPGLWGFAVPSIKNTSNSFSPVQLQNNPPRIVMEDAWINNNSTLYFSGSSDYPIGSMVTYCYVMELNGSGRSSNMEYSVNNILIDTINASSVPQEIVSSVTVPDSYYNLTFKPTDSSTLPPILNAVEVYFEVTVDTSFTIQADVSSIRGVQKAFNLTDWTGDPCRPYPYDWVNCTAPSHVSGRGMAFNEYSMPEYRISGLSIGNMAANVTEMKTIPPEIAHLAELTTLNLSGNGLSGTPISLSQLLNLTVVDISQNIFSGDVMEFVSSIGIHSVQQLNLGGNRFSKFSINNSFSLENLITLDLSNNFFDGDVMDFVKSVGNYNMKGLYAANNSLQGQFSTAELNKQLFEDIRILDFDGQNISGTLNLSDWHLAWSSSVLGPDSLETVTQLIYLRNNNIETVYPAVDILSGSIKDAYDNFWRLSPSNNGGVLLSGNPWCRTSDQSLAHRYLCRNDTSDLVDYSTTGGAQPSSKKTWPIAVGVSVGACIFFFCFSMFVRILRKLRSKSYALAEIQEALARQKVQPPFYSYVDIRAATKNFSDDNNLGQGAYGAVYRGKLDDGTLVAVKRLFKDRQSLAEFLNETVLITGIKHRNLTQLKGCCINENQRMLVYEYAENGNLAEALWGESGTTNKMQKRTEAALSWQKRLNLCMGIARGLAYLHEELQPRIIHRDIKPANILIDQRYNAKIADFGLARSFLEEETRAEYTHVAGTFGYLAPEYVTQGQLTEKADVFSFGVVLLEIVSGRKCINQSLPTEKISLVNWANTLRKQGSLMDIVDSSVKFSSDDEEVLRVIEIAFSCLHLEPAQRPSMSQVVSRLQGNGNAVFKQSSRSNFFPAVTGEKSTRFGLVRSISLTSSRLDASDQQAYLLDHTQRRDGLEMSSISGR